MALKQQYFPGEIESQAQGYWEKNGSFKAVDHAGSKEKF